jgi:DNA-binding NarL/FixJ family response regulator
MSLVQMTRMEGANAKEAITLAQLDESSFEVATSKSVSSVRSFSELCVVVIEPRVLARDCLVTSLRSASPSLKTLSFSTVQEWLKFSGACDPVSVVLLSVGNRVIRDGQIDSDISLLINSPDKTPVVLISDVEDAEQIMCAIESGVRGFISSSISLNIAIEAMHLVTAGGIYVPADSLLSWRNLNESVTPADKSVSDRKFTVRQNAVLQALRQGKANKIIAYELNMRESTVKVHVRNIMRKLKARNRTEVAYLTSHETSS